MFSKDLNSFLHLDTTIDGFSNDAQDTDTKSLKFYLFDEYPLIFDESSCEYGGNAYNTMETPTLLGFQLLDDYSGVVNPVMPADELAKQKDVASDCTKMYLPTSMSYTCVRFDPISGYFRTAHNEVYTFCPDYDKLLQALVQCYGGKPNWRHITEVLKRQCPKGRKFTPQQCYYRYHRVTRPGLVKGRWSYEDSRKLFSLLNRHPCGYIQEIFRYFPDRSDNQIRFKIKYLYPQWFTC